jgi:hypothetical protein
MVTRSYGYNNGCEIPKPDVCTGTVVLVGYSRLGYCGCFTLKETDGLIRLNALPMAEKTAGSYLLTTPSTCRTGSCWQACGRGKNAGRSVGAAKIGNFI